MFVKRQKLYLEAQERLKLLESEFNRYKLDKKESETKISSLKDEVLVASQNIKELELSVSEFTSARIEMLNVADLDVYEKEITTKYKTSQEREQLGKTALNELKTKYE